MPCFVKFEAFFIGPSHFAEYISIYLVVLRYDGLAHLICQFVAAIFERACYLTIGRLRHGDYKLIFTEPRRFSINFPVNIMILSRFQFTKISSYKNPSTLIVLF